MNQFNLSDGTYIRYTERGEGPSLLLLHTIRNRIEYYEKLLPLLTKKFKVFCIELPGHGDSPINKKTNYNIEFITDSIVEFIDQKQLEDITIAGESIGAVLASTVAIKIPSKVEKIHCFNPYDYDSWDFSRKQSVFINLVSANDWKKLTGEVIPKVPITSKKYKEQNLPWFIYDHDTDINISKKMSKLKSIKDFGLEIDEI